MITLLHSCVLFSTSRISLGSVTSAICVFCFACSPVRDLEVSIDSTLPTRRGRPPQFQLRSLTPHPSPRLPAAPPSPPCTTSRLNRAASTRADAPSIAARRAESRHFSAPFAPFFVLRFGDAPTVRGELATGSQQDREEGPAGSRRSSVGTERGQGWAPARG